ncbi:GNAT family N-acetyltransferase [Corynebacterium callunae]|uniref:GNAT family N-acetyltransferase n=1 Tax=Corynebacterium callunae TaxID=1721 RepID=UPI00103FF9F8|nr:GNAT family N-acetyltransferase [Corynebacterium callunae]MCK2201745.1 GNAT family N-acetyltransferase [Corynebacterium callunae]
MKQIWTSKDYRRRGLSRRIITALEDAAAEFGYRRFYFTREPRRREAETYIYQWATHHYLMSMKIPKGN